MVKKIVKIVGMILCIIAISTGVIYLITEPNLTNKKISDDFEISTDNKIISFIEDLQLRRIFSDIILIVCGAILIYYFIQYIKSDKENKKKTISKYVIWTIIIIAIVKLYNMIKYIYFPFSERVFSTLKYIIYMFVIIYIFNKYFKKEVVEYIKSEKDKKRIKKKIYLVLFIIYIIIGLILCEDYYFVGSVYYLTKIVLLWIAIDIIIKYLVTEKNIFKQSKNKNEFFITNLIILLIVVLFNCIVIYIIKELNILFNLAISWIDDNFFLIFIYRTIKIILLNNVILTKVFLDIILSKQIKIAEDNQKEKMMVKKFGICLIAFLLISGITIITKYIQSPYNLVLENVGCRFEIPYDIKEYSINFNEGDNINDYLQIIQIDNDGIIIEYEKISNKFTKEGLDESREKVRIKLLWNKKYKYIDNNPLKLQDIFYDYYIRFDRIF